MPAASYLDLLSSTWRENLWINHGVFRISDLPEVVLSFYLRLVHGLVPGLQSLVETTNADGRLDINSYNIFIASSNAPHYLFVLKLPFLFLDLISLTFIFKMFNNSLERCRAVAAWALFPFLLYAVYIWGRYEIFPIFFTLGAYYFAKNRRNFIAMIFMGMAIAMKASFVLYAPFLIIFLSKTTRDYIVNAVSIFIWPFLISRTLSFFGAEPLVSGLERGGFLEFATFGYLGNGMTAMSLTIAVYIGLVTLYFRDRSRRSTFELLVAYSAMALVSYFAFSKFHAHYLSWITPVFILAVAYWPKLIWWLAGLACCYVFLIDSVFGPTVTWGLFLPLCPGCGTWGGLIQQPLWGQFGASTLAMICHTFFVLLIVGINIILYRSRYETQ